MISLTTVVWVIFWIIVAAAIFGLLWWAIQVAFARIPGALPFKWIAELFLLLAAIFVGIGILLSLLTGQQLFRL